MRHGETAWNAVGRFQGALDSPLTPRGRDQARAMGCALAGLDPGAHDALTSPQGRAVETAALALGPLGFAPRHEPALVEIGMGAWTGLTRSEVAARWPGPPGEALLDLYARGPGGEPLEAVAARAGALLARLRRPTILVTHGVTLRVLCALACGRPLAWGGALELRQGEVLLVERGRLDRIGADMAGLPERPAAR